MDPVIEAIRERATLRSERRLARRANPQNGEQEEADIVCVACQDKGYRIEIEPGRTANAVTAKALALKGRKIACSCRSERKETRTEAPGPAEAPPASTGAKNNRRPPRATDARI